MLLKDNKVFTMPRLMGGSFSGMDRVYIPHNILVLKNVTQRDDNGDIELLCQAKDGPEQISGKVRFPINDRQKKDLLYKWLTQQIGKNIETIYRSKFIFGDESVCPQCGSKIFQSMEPKVANLANINSKMPKQMQFLRCSNMDCNYIEKI